MKIRNKWDGITVILASAGDNKQEPFYSKKRFEGLTEESKVLVYDENSNISQIELKLGGMDIEVEVSLEESIQNIKNVKEISRMLREETTEWISFIGEIMEATKCKPEPVVVHEPTHEQLTPEDTEVKPDVANAISEGIKAAMAKIMGK